jgi:hypothetical protein
MNTYEIQIDERISHCVEVEAENEEEALLKGYEIIMNGPDTEYDSESKGVSASYVIRTN